MLLTNFERETVSEAESDRFLVTLESDEALAKRLLEIQDSPDEVYNEIKRLGFDCTVDEIRDAFLMKISRQLDENSLQLIAAGIASGNESSNAAITQTLKVMQITGVVANAVHSANLAAASAF